MSTFALTLSTLCTKSGHQGAYGVANSLREVCRVLVITPPRDARNRPRYLGRTEVCGMVNWDDKGVIMGYFRDWMLITLAGLCILAILEICFG